MLAFTPRAAAREIEKVLRSAVANAEANHGLIGDELVVVAAVVDEGPTMKRWRARARGRVARIKKRTCHITIELRRGAASAGSAPRRRRQEAHGSGAGPGRGCRRRHREAEARAQGSEARGAGGQGRRNGDEEPSRSR